MILHNEPSFLIYFGDAKGCCVKSLNKISIECLTEIQKTLNLKQIIFLNQVHGSDGICINDLSKLKTTSQYLKQDGDFIITNLRKIGIGVLTADCLPVIFYDPVRHVSAVIHVGWKGAVDGVIEKVCEIMKEKFKTNPSSLIVYFGPSAKVCCYKVQNSFLENLENYSFFDQVIFQKEDGIFFNLSKFVEIQLTELGIKLKNINKEYNACTICDSNFHSYRRDGKTAGRQATVVVLK